MSKKRYQRDGQFTFIYREHSEQISDDVIAFNDVMTAVFTDEDRQFWTKVTPNIPHMSPKELYRMRKILFRKLMKNVADYYLMKSYEQEHNTNT